jgi:hypothetical protein
MTRQLASIPLAAFLTALSPIGFPTAQAKQQCSAIPANPQGSWWSYRLIDGRKCWYEGKPGLSKSLLEWPKEASAQPASGEEIVNPVTEKPRSPLDSQAWAPNSRAQVPAAAGAVATDPDTFETQWSARATVETRAPPKEAASVTLWPVAPEDGDGPPLRKADKLQSPYFDSSQPKSIRTLVIIPDQPLPAQTSPSFRHP